MPVLRVGVIGCGEVAQVCHIPNFNLLADKYLITYLCDVSRQALNFCARMVRGGQSPKTTTDPEELCSSPDVDLVLICSADEYHIPHGLTALKYDKWCLIEKPLALCFRDVDAIIEAEKKSKGKVMVGTMRRYAPGFADAVKEVGGMEKITYARVRAIIGNNSNFISQSGTFPLGAPSDVSKADAEDKTKRNEDITSCALEKEFGVQKNEQSMRMLRILGGLNSHDLSAMRDIIGMPKKVIGASLGFPGIYTALLQYDGFPVTFESGVNTVPVFDANIEVYSADKIVRIQYDSPYVKGLPVKMVVRDRMDSDAPQGSYAYRETTITKTYQDPFTTELLELYECVVNGKPVKTSAEDARNEVELFKMILQAGEKTYHST